MMPSDDLPAPLLRGLLRLVDRVGSYADESTALCGIARDLVAELGLEGATVWRQEAGVLRRLCGAGNEPDSAFAGSALAGERVEEARMAFPMRAAGRTSGVLATNGAMAEPGRALVRMLAGRCAHILRDSHLAKAQQVLLRGLSHELRAPLQALLGHLDLVREGSLGPLTAAQTEALSAVAAGADRILAVCGDVLQVARIDSGHETAIRGEVALDQLLAREVAAVEPLARRAGLRIGLECPEGLTLESDGAKLARVVTNLLSNAVKYTPDGTVSVRAERLPGGGCAIEVADTGVGIPVEHQQAVFDEYVRLGGVTREGTGLGLPIVRRLVDLLDGEVTLESQPGRGTRVRVVIPR